MNNERDNTNSNEADEDRSKPLSQTETHSSASAKSVGSHSGALKVGAIAITATVLIAIAGIAVWRFWPTAGGKPVPAPRSVSFEQSSQPQTAMTGEQKLTLTSEQLKMANLKIETVGEMPAAMDSGGQMSTGVVQANATKETPVVALVGGIVRRVDVQLGQSVKRGQNVAMIFSNELADAQSRYLAAMTALDEHHRHHLRTAKLVEIGAASREELDSATTKYREAETTLANVRQKLMLLGLSAQRIESLNSSSQISSEVMVSAPSSGVVTSRTVNPGEVIEANKELLRVTDLSTVWVVGQVYEKDLGKIHIGSGADIMSETYPGRIFRGRVAYVDPKIEQTTRTAQVRIELANPNQMFKIGMYLNISFGALTGAMASTTAIPKDAVQNIENQQIVFVATAEPNVFAVHPVRLGVESNDRYPVLEGLSAGDRIVTEGSFQLRAEWLKVNPGAHIH
jgi:membrane fusion protein, heavy metal efflux system